MNTSKQEQFLQHLVDFGDRDLAMNTLQVTRGEFFEWLNDPTFKSEVEKIENHHTQNLITKITQQAFKQLDSALENGLVITTQSTSRSENPQLGVFCQEKTTIKKIDISLPAVAQAIKLYILMKAEADVINSIAALASRGLLPSNSEQLIASTMAEYTQKIKLAMQGDRDEIGVDETILAKIQQMVIQGG